MGNRIQGDKTLIHCVSHLRSFQQRARSSGKASYLQWEKASQMKSLVGASADSNSAPALDTNRTTAS